MPNHFHLLVKVKSSKNLAGLGDLPGLASTDVVSQKFSNFFNSYTKSVNKQQSRHGSLFEKPFKRKIVENDEYFQTLVYCIHNNPVHHGFTEKIEDWDWSSYHSIILVSKNNLKVVQ
jgi:REP element-mobilizing transposase RayT